MQRAIDMDGADVVAVTFSPDVLPDGSGAAVVYLACIKRRSGTDDELLVLEAGEGAGSSSSSDASTSSSSSSPKGGKKNKDKKNKHSHNHGANSNSKFKEHFKSQPGGLLSSLTISPCGTLLIVAGERALLYIYSLASSRRVAVCGEHELVEKMKNGEIRCCSIASVGAGLVEALLPEINENSNGNGKSSSLQKQSSSSKMVRQSSTSHMGGGGMGMGIGNGGNGNAVGDPNFASGYVALTGSTPHEVILLDLRPMLVENFDETTNHGKKGHANHGSDSHGHANDHTTQHGLEIECRFNSRR